MYSSTAEVTVTEVVIMVVMTTSPWLQSKSVQGKEGRKEGGGSGVYLRSHSGHFILVLSEVHLRVPLRQGLGSFLYTCKDGGKDRE